MGEVDGGGGLFLLGGLVGVLGLGCPVPQLFFRFNFIATCSFAIYSTLCFLLVIIVV